LSDAEEARRVRDDCRVSHDKAMAMLKEAQTVRDAAQKEIERFRGEMRRANDRHVDDSHALERLTARNAELVRSNARLAAAIRDLLYVSPEGMAAQVRRTNEVLKSETGDLGTALGGVAPGTNEHLAPDNDPPDLALANCVRDLVVQAQARGRREAFAEARDRLEQLREDALGVGGTIRWLREKAAGK
jgi:hypothetical protein